MNAARNCGQLSVELLKRVSSALSVPRRQASHAQALAAHLLGVSVSLLKRTLQMVDMNGGQPTVTEPDRPAVSVVHQSVYAWRWDVLMSARVKTPSKGQSLDTFRPSRRLASLVSVSFKVWR